MEAFWLRVSKPVYLHFFDRQLTSHTGVYRYVSSEEIITDFSIIALTFYEEMYMSTGHLLEHEGALQIFHAFPDLFRFGHITVAQRENSFINTVHEKRDQYSHVSDLSHSPYANYFNSAWQEVMDSGVTVRRNLADTGRMLSSRLTRRLQRQSRRRPVRLEDYSSIEDARRLIDRLQERGKRAVTIELFNDLESVSSLGLARMRPLISNEYTDIYIDNHEATICSGLPFGLYDYEQYCTTYPYHHFPLWRRVYAFLGCLPYLRRLKSVEMLSIREAPSFRQFIDAIRQLVRAATLSTFDAEFGSPSKGIRRIDAIVQFVLTRTATPVLEPVVAVDGFLKVVSRCADRLAADGWVDYADVVLEHPPLIGARSVATDISRNVFVVYGRDAEARTQIYALLRAAGLNPLEWEQVVALSRRGSPYVGDVLEAGFKNCQAVVTLFTGDDIARLKPELAGGAASPEELQPRPNVLFEAGMALGMHPDRTIIVEFGDLRAVSDLTGRHVIRWDGTVATRKNLLSRLATAGCKVDLTGNDWMTV